ncbi:hypothetical protein MIR68_011694 [Amoeboaphelidium protococcarum]|nr:hypothetical protein MIR68_011694 [Amoeboaphelidium protococcarum]
MINGKKLSGYDLYKALGSPKCVVAPMVDASELPWRVLSSIYGAQLCYTPMIHARMTEHQFEINSANRCCNHFYDSMVNVSADRQVLKQIGYNQEEIDSPLIAQICANDPDTLLNVARMIAAEGHVKAIDLNLGCPQGIAKRGHYGAFLMEDWDLIYRLINTLHKELDIPVTAKIRVFDDLDKTIEYARMIRNAGAQILTVHGRTREMKGVNTGLADWDKIRAVRQAITDIPVFSNGNILYFEDIQSCLDHTGCDAVMVSETNLYNPAVFAPSLAQPEQYLDVDFCGKDFLSKAQNIETYPLLIEHPPATQVAIQYVLAAFGCKFGRLLKFDGEGSEYDAAHRDQYVNEGKLIVKVDTTMDGNLKFHGASSIGGHIFKLLRSILDVFPQYRPKLGIVRTLADYLSVLRELQKRIEDDVQNDESQWSLLTRDGAVVRECTPQGVPVKNGFRILPYWVLQPYVRCHNQDKPASATVTIAASDQSNQVDSVVNQINSSRSLTAEESKQHVIEQRELRKARRLHSRMQQKEDFQRKVAMYGKDRVANWRHLKCAGCSNVASSRCLRVKCSRCCQEAFHSSTEAIKQQAEQCGNPGLQLKDLPREQLVSILCPCHCGNQYKKYLQDKENVEQ